ncbi:hypothetical protein [Streptomyces sp. NPDC060035]|uniref:hypothetical protein n=1 Tax=Streptomyces sp. NPDC060035 TaxID=3347044 RepID=UPI00369B0FD5
MRLGRGVITGMTTAALFLVTATGCDDPDASQSRPMPAAPPVAVPAPSSTPGRSGSAEPSASPSPSAERTAGSSAPSSPGPPRTVATVAPSSVPTFLSMAVATTGGRIGLVRGGNAQELTLTLRNGNSRAYDHLRLVFQMEILVDGTPGAERPPQDGFTLERWDGATGTWRREELRIANDALPYSSYAGGFRLARDAERTERYRLRALDAGPTGSTPLMVNLIDTGAPEGAPLHRVRPASFIVPHTTRRD